MLDLSEFLPFKFSSSSVSQEGKRSVNLERKKLLENHSASYGIRYFVYISYREERLVIGSQTMYIACNDTSVILINFRKSKTLAKADTYCILFRFINENSNVWQNEQVCGWVLLRKVSLALTGFRWSGVGFVKTAWRRSFGTKLAKRCGVVPTQIFFLFQ